MDNKQWVWMLGGGIQNLPMSIQIKDRGYRLLITDSNPDCVCSSLADQFEAISVYDLSANLNFAARLGFTPAAVLTVATDAGVEVSAVAKYFSLPAASPNIARQVRNKAMMRSLLNAPSPKFRAGVIYSQFADWSIFPCVVKSADNSGSKGFSVVHSQEELPAALIKARKANRGGVNTVLVEEYIEKRDFLPELTDWDTSEAAVEGFIVSGQWIQVNGALRLFHRDRPGIEAGHFNPFTLDNKTAQLLNGAAHKLGVEEGPLKFDLMYTERGWIILEAATRLSGGFDHSYTSPLATGRDVTGLMLDYALGLPFDVAKAIIKQDRVACCLAPVHEPGQIAGWVNPPNEASYVFFNDKDGEIRPLESNADRPLFIICDAGNRAEALEKCLRVAEQVKPLYVED